MVSKNDEESLKKVAAGSSRPTADESAVISDEDLDQILAEEDPDFLKGLSDIAKEKGLGLSEIEDLSFDQQYVLDLKDSLRSSKAGRLILAVFPPLPLLFLFVRKIKFQLFKIVEAQKVRAKNFIFFLRTSGKDKALAHISQKKSAVLGSLKAFLLRIKALSLKLKLALVLLLIATLSVAGYFYYAYQFHLFSSEDSLFITDLTSKADKVYVINQEADSESFYDNVRVVRNIFLIPKMVVNLKRSTNSGPNPMGAFEFFIESFSPEVLVEFKERETEMKDLMYRTIEAFTFDQAETVEGKRELCLALAKEVNRRLKSGRLKRVFIKTAIIKP